MVVEIGELFVDNKELGLTVFLEIREAGLVYLVPSVSLQAYPGVEALLDGVGDILDAEVIGFSDKTGHVTHHKDLWAMLGEEDEY